MKIAYLVRGRPDLPDMIPPDVDYVVLEAGKGGVWSPEALEKVADVDAFVVSMEPVNEQILAHAGRLKIVQRLGVGYETLDLEAAARRGIPCCNVEGVNKEAVAEHGMALILALTKRLLEADRLTRELRWSEARLLTKQTFELNGKTLGVVGLGNTGSSLAKRARAFDMRIVYNDIRPIDPEILETTGAHFLEKEALYKTADIISVNTDLNDSTRNLIDAGALSLMKPGALFVCCARGGVVDEPALRAALDEGRLAGAGIDVFTTEPITPDNPLLGARNLILTSHVAGITEETTRRTFAWAHDNVRAVVERAEKPRWVRNGV